MKPLHFTGELVARQPAIEQTHGVPAAEQFLDNVPPDELSTTQDQNLHRRYSRLGIDSASFQASRPRIRAASNIAAM